MRCIGSAKRLGRARSTDSASSITTAELPTSRAFAPGRRCASAATKHTNTKARDTRKSGSFICLLFSFSDRSFDSLTHTGVMKMADRYRKSVGRVVWRRHRLHLKEQAYHLLHLVLFGISIADYRLLY